MENDLIRRSELLAKKCIIRGRLDTEPPCPSKVTAIPVDVIERAPAVDAVVVRHGRWDYYEESSCIRAHARCSVCNRPRYEHYVFNDFLYCPYCGAKMDGGKSNE